MNTYAQKVQEFLLGSEVVKCEEDFKVVFEMRQTTPVEMKELLEERFEVVIDEPVIDTFIHCPHCDVHLSNGVDTTDHMVEDHNPQRVAFGHEMKLEFLCLGCNSEFGKPNPHYRSKAKAKATHSVATGEGLKIQKNREEKNGVKRPSEGGKCATLWSLFDTMYAEKGMVPTPKPAKDRSALQGMDPTTTQVQLYRWREFMGFKGK